MTETPDLITADQAATRMGVSRRTIHKHVESGRLTCALKLPGITGTMLFRPADVDALAAQRRAKLEAELASLAAASPLTETGSEQ